MNKNILKEAIADIALEAGYALALNKITIDDSRGFIDDIIYSGEQFAKKFKNNKWIDTDYMEEIQDWAFSFIKEYNKYRGQL